MLYGGFLCSHTQSDPALNHWHQNKENNDDED